MNSLRSREGRDTLLDLRERLCILWGDLEEQKSSVAPIKAFSSTLAIEPASSPPLLKAGGQPSVDSDDENSPSVQQTDTKASRGPALKNRDLNASLNGNALKTEEQPVIHNKAFTCCIKQYGVKVIEKDTSKANAGIGKRWERKFGLFGVVIQ